MKLHTINTVAVLLAVLGLVIPTGAVISGDHVGEQGIVLTPHHGPNGGYVDVGTEETLAIDLATIGVNPDALTSVRNVFEVANPGEEPLDVWVAHNATDSVTFAVDGVGSIQGEENTLTLGSGESEAVSLYIDTVGDGPSDEPLLTGFEISVAPVTDEPSKPTLTPTATPRPPSTPAPPPRAAPVEGVEDVEVVFDDAVEGPVLVREVSTEEIERLGVEDDTRGPEASIAHAHGAESPIGDECPCADDPRLQALGAQALVEVGQEVTLSGATSLVGSMNSVDPERRLVKSVDIDPPAGRHDEPATVRIRVAEERFAETGLAGARIGRQTDDGWQLLPTRVAGRVGDEVILEARTPGFSIFAVFATTSVQYAWQIDGETIAAEEVRHKWTEPGLYNVTMTVTDAFGRVDIATYRILVNDPPSVWIEAPADITAGEPTTLRANVTNEFGNATVTWVFPDGSQKTGAVVEHVFDAGDQTVRVLVEDEFGATAEQVTTFSVATVGGREPIIDRIAGDVPLRLQLGAITLLSGVLVLLRRRLRAGRPLTVVDGLRGIGDSAIRSVLPLRGRTPHVVVAVESPTVDVRNRCFRIGHLRVEEPGGHLETVEIGVLDSQGTEVAHKTVDVGGRHEYESRGEIVLPKSRVYVRADEAYSVQVRARDRTDRWSGRAESSIPPPTGAGTSP